MTKSTDHHGYKLGRPFLVFLMLALIALLPACCVWGIAINFGQRGGSPKNIAIAPDGRAYINDYGNFSQLLPFRHTCIWIVDTNQDRLVHVLKTDNAGLITAAPNNKVYNFENSRSFKVEVIPAGGTSVEKRLVFNEKSPVCVGYGPDGNMLLSLGHQDRLDIFDPNTDQFVATYPLTVSTFYFAVAPGRQAYIADDGHIWIVDLNTSRIIGEVAHVPPHGYGGIIASDEHVCVLYAEKQSEDWKYNLIVIDRAQNQFVGTITDLPIPSWGSIAGMVAVPGERIYLLVVGPEPDYGYEILIVDTKTTAMVGRIDLGREPDYSPGWPVARMAMAPNGKVYVVYGARHALRKPNPPSPSTETGLYVIDPQQDQVVDFIPFERPLWFYLFPF